MSKREAKLYWKKMTGMRNKILHEYFGIDIEILWKTIQEDLPVLQKALASPTSQPTE